MERPSRGAGGAHRGRIHCFGSCCSPDLLPGELDNSAPHPPHRPPFFSRGSPPGPQTAPYPPPPSESERRTAPLPTTRFPGGPPGRFQFLLSAYLGRVRKGTGAPSFGQPGEGDTGLVGGGALLSSPEFAPPF